MMCAYTCNSSRCQNTSVVCVHVCVFVCTSAYVREEGRDCGGVECGKQSGRRSKGGGSLNLKVRHSLHALAWPGSILPSPTPLQFAPATSTR